MHLALIHRKANEGKLQKPISFKFTFLANAVTVQEESMDDVPGFIDQLPLAEQLVAQLRDNGPLTVTELTELTNQPRASIAVTLSRDIRFSTGGNKRWVLTQEIRTP